MRPYASEMEDDLPPLIVHIGRLLAVHLNLKRTDIPTNGHTDGRTYVRTDVRTDRPSYRDVKTHLKLYSNQCLTLNICKRLDPCYPSSVPFVRLSVCLESIWSTCPSVYPSIHPSIIISYQGYYVDQSCINKGEQRDPQTHMIEND